MQPVLGATDYRNVLWLQTDFFVQFPIQGLLRSFMRLDPALRKLPSAVATTPRPEYPVIAVAENDAHIRTVTLFVNHVLTTMSHRPGR